MKWSELLNVYQEYAKIRLLCNTGSFWIMGSIIWSLILWVFHSLVQIGLVISWLALGCCLIFMHYHWITVQKCLAYLFLEVGVLISLICFLEASYFSVKWRKYKLWITYLNLGYHFVSSKTAFCFKEGSSKK